MPRASAPLDFHLALLILPEHVQHALIVLAAQLV
jgi:hypothetical protein